uniref:Uncharacterized protein n=1 Tax=Macrostomum lignano TaxID=282301 RepID=A0A1I8GVK2_9PLAT
MRLRVHRTPAPEETRGRRKRGAEQLISFLCTGVWRSRIFRAGRAR